MRQSVITAELDSTGGASPFLRQQRRHQCVDCGHTHLEGPASTVGPHHRRRRFGAGTIVSSARGPITELHIVPHGGTELPADLIEETDPENFEPLADLVHQNVDLGTGAIYRRLVDDVRSGAAEGVAVAGFHLSRLLIDANRASVEGQLPNDPYVGSAELYRGYLRRRGRDLRHESLLPWLDAVDEVLESMDNRGTVYHHHTYDVLSMSPRPWDRGVAVERPAFQLIWKRPSLDGVIDDSEPDPGLAPLADVEDVRRRIRGFLEREIGLPNGNGDIDYPLLLPVMPFKGSRRGDPPTLPRHLVYDLRKDVLATDEQIRAWVLDGPWRLAGGHRDGARSGGDGAVSAYFG
ncbi:N-formylglutamate amidohydrolase [Micromonospora sp. NBC_01699]|uniref:hypothetical protein n=1 Tax=Micromonospora sp. NBC_01699 TaxID=2975984 RepID=UPI002E2C0EC9|nr:hypothetical protein [Micromonospora sp. NBC_01699]